MHDESETPNCPNTYENCEENERDLGCAESCPAEVNLVVQVAESGPNIGNENSDAGMVFTLKSSDQILSSFSESGIEMILQV